MTYMCKVLWRSPSPEDLGSGLVFEICSGKPFIIVITIIIVIIIIVLWRVRSDKHFITILGGA